MIRGLVTPEIAGCDPFELDLENWFSRAPLHEVVAFAAMNWNTDRPVGISTPGAVWLTVEVLRFYRDSGEPQCNAVLQAHKVAADARREQGRDVDMDALPRIRAHEADVGRWISERRPDLVKAAQRSAKDPEFAGGVAKITLCAGGPFDNPVPWERPADPSLRLDDGPGRRALGRKEGGRLPDLLWLQSG